MTRYGVTTAGVYLSVLALGLTPRSCARDRASGLDAADRAARIAVRSPSSSFPVSRSARRDSSRSTSSSGARSRCACCRGAGVAAGTRRRSSRREPADRIERCSMRSRPARRPRRQVFRLVYATPAATARAQRRPSACRYSAFAKSCARRATTFARRWRVAMTPDREDFELYVMGNYDGDVDALERRSPRTPRSPRSSPRRRSFEEVLRDAAAAATFCAACTSSCGSSAATAAASAVRPGGYTSSACSSANAHGRM